MKTHPDGHSDLLSQIVRTFLNSNLSIILILFSLLIGAAALWITPREEDPQIVVPLADVFVQYPGHSAAEVEQLVSTPLERLLYQIDGVEYVYSMSQDNQAIITVRFYVGQDRERSLVKLFKKLNENGDLIPSGVTGWVMKPVEIDDVPVVTMTLTGAQADSYALRRVSEELVERLAVVPQVSRSYLVGGEPRSMTVEWDPQRLAGWGVSLAELRNALAAANVSLPAGGFQQLDRLVQVESRMNLDTPESLGSLVIGVSKDRPVFLRDVAAIRDGPSEIEHYVRFGWGPARHAIHHAGSPGLEILPPGVDHATSESSLAEHSQPTGNSGNSSKLSSQSTDNTHQEMLSQPAVTIAIAKQKGANAVTVAKNILKTAEQLRAEVIPDDMQLLITRNNGLTADEKVNELVEALAVAIVIVILLLTLGMGWREAFIVAIAVPVVFGLTLAVNLLFGYTINRVTLFALILSLGLLVDDPIVDVENIARHFEEKKKASRKIVLDAIAEIRPPLISATLAVIVSFLPMFFITGMMGPYMSPMALNVPVAMLMSMVVAFTITPWLTYQVLKRGYPNEESHPEVFALGTESSLSEAGPNDSAHSSGHAAYDPEVIRKTFLYRLFRPLMVPMLKTRLRAWLFLLMIAGLTFGAMGMGALRMVPLKMLPFDNKNELLIVLDMPEGTTLERTDSVIQELELTLAATPEVTHLTSYVGTPGPIDFNGLVRHYYLRQLPHQAEIRVGFVSKKNRRQQSHGIGLRIRDRLSQIAAAAGGLVRVVELPPGPPVLASLVAEVYGDLNQPYEQILSAGDIVQQRLAREPGVVETDGIREVAAAKSVFVVDQEKAALAGISTAEIAATLQSALAGDQREILRVVDERNPLRIHVRMPRALRSSIEELGQLIVKNPRGDRISIAELGSWEQGSVGQTIYHKNLKRVAYVFAECAGRTPAECIVDVTADQLPSKNNQGNVSAEPARPVAGRTFLSNGSGIQWHLPQGTSMTFAGEGEWKITLDVFRDLGLAFGAAMIMIYIILVAQTDSFAMPLVVMLAIPLTVLGVMPGFYLLNLVQGDMVGGYSDPVYFTATAMIGMIALAGIVTRDAIILVDFMELAMRQGRPLFDAILESRVVRLRPILLTAGAALLSAIPITLDPIFSGLGWSLIFGLVASTLFTLFVIPATFWLLHQRGRHTS